LKTEIFIVTFRRDFPYLEWCLRSISKFATGFDKVHILVPDSDLNDLMSLPKPANLIGIVAPKAFSEWPKLGFVHHMWQILNADKWCPDADFIVHIDGDCIFNAPVIPETYITKGRPILRYEPFDRLGRRHPGSDVWRQPTQKCVPFHVVNETMRCHPEVYHRDLYRVVRETIATTTKMDAESYLKSTRNEYPHQFCEFNTLGNVAMTMFPQRYHMVELFGDRAVPDNCLHQFWSRGEIDKPQQTWIRGELKTVVPLDMMRSILT